MKKYGEVLTEHVGSSDINAMGETHLTEKQIHDRDMQWLNETDIVIAEVSTASLGVGYEVGRAIELNKKILCLYRSQDGKSLSAMIAGSPDVKNAEYVELDDAKKVIDEFLREKLDSII